MVIVLVDDGLSSLVDHIVVLGQHVNGQNRVLLKHECSWGNSQGPVHQSVQDKLCRGNEQVDYLNCSLDVQQRVVLGVDRVCRSCLIWWSAYTVRMEMANVELSNMLGDRCRVRVSLTYGLATLGVAQRHVLLR